MVERPLHQGIYCPIITPFTKDDIVDYDAFAKQIERVCNAGASLVIHGTNGEAIHLDLEERIATIKYARTMIGNGPLIAGVGGGSTRETIKFAKEASGAGADYALVIAPAYFSAMWGKNSDAVYKYFTSVADSSPIPVIVYNFPAVSGIDLDSDILISLSEHQNIVGVKLTCANISKGMRVAHHTKSSDYKKRHTKQFFVFSGKSDYMLPAVVGDHDGCITALANIAPKTCVKLFNLAIEAVNSHDKTKWKEAKDLQEMVSVMDWENGKSGIAGVKYALDYHLNGLGGPPRSPLVPPNETLKRAIESNLKSIIEYENGL